MVNQNIVIITGELMKIDRSKRDSVKINVMVPDLDTNYPEKFEFKLFGRSAEIIGLYAEKGDNITLNCHAKPILIVSGSFELVVNSVAFVGGSFKMEGIE